MVANVPGHGRDCPHGTTVGKRFSRPTWVGSVEVIDPFTTIGVDVPPGPGVHVVTGVPAVGVRVAVPVAVPGVTLPHDTGAE